jgi:hypothetical protein
MTIWAMEAAEPMRSAKHHMIVLVVFLLASQTISVAGDLNGMYSEADLKYWKGILEPLVNQIVQQEIQPILNLAGQKISHIHIQMPTAGSNDFLGYDISGDTVTISVVSLKFLYDLFAAHLWLQEKGFDDPIMLYLSALKYQEASRFPARRRPSPLEALAIPHNNTLKVTGVTSSHAFQQLFNAALLFILAHEVGHALLDEVNQSTVTQEEQADLFAFAVMAHARYNPGGVVPLFLWMSILTSNAADFPTVQKYEEWLKKDSKHPLNGLRLGMVGFELTNNPRQFFPGAPDSDPRIGMLKQIGSGMIRLGADVDNLASRKILRDAALDIDIRSLAVHKPSQNGKP